MATLFIELSIMMYYCDASHAVSRIGNTLVLGATAVVTTVATNPGWWAWVSASAATAAASIWAYASSAAAFVVTGVAYVTFGGILIVGIWVVYHKLTQKPTSVQYVDEQRNIVQYQATKLNHTQKQQILAAKQNIHIHCFHVSCRSDHPGAYKNDWYAIGFVLYSYNHEQEWKMNGIRCQSGYIVLISSTRVKEEKRQGFTFHDTAFKMIFGRYPNELKNTLIAGGFSIENGKNVYNSTTFNYGPKRKTKYGFAERDTIHFGTRVMNPMEQKYIAHAVDNWINKKQQNTKVSSIPDDDILCVHPDYLQNVQ